MTTSQLQQICPKCAVAFSGTHRAQRYCSAKCRTASYQGRRTLNAHGQQIADAAVTEIVLRLREARASLGISQTEASRRSGIGVKSLSAFECGTRRVTLDVCAVLADAYGLTLADLLTFDLERGLGFRSVA